MKRMSAVILSLMAAAMVIGPARVAVTAQQPPAASASAPSALQRDGRSRPVTRRSVPPRTAAPTKARAPSRRWSIRGAMLIDGTGGPPRGPVDIVVESNRITAVASAGTPGLPLRANRAPQADYEVDATGMYVMPGLRRPARARRRRAEERRTRSTPTSCGSRTA